MEIDQIYSGWASRTETLHERIDVHRVRALAATLNIRGDFADGDSLPPGWQWLFFNPVAARSALGDDGHPRRDVADSFLPPVPLPRRMWAGSQVSYLHDVPIGADATRVSQISKLAHKEGRAGKLFFVTVEHRISVGEKVCIVERQDIVYREAGATSLPPAAAPEIPVDFETSFTADSPLLFRYSALTFNGHRIHYDKPYATEVEGYRDLVVHGPLSATLVQDFALRCKPGHRLIGFEFRGVSPLFVNETAELQAWQEPHQPFTLNMRVIDAHGTLSMQATAELDAR